MSMHIVSPTPPPPVAEVGTLRECRSSIDMPPLSDAITHKNAMQRELQVKCGDEPIEPPTPTDVSSESSEEVYADGTISRNASWCTSSWTEDRQALIDAFEEAVREAESKLERMKDRLQEMRRLAPEASAEQWRAVLPDEQKIEILRRDTRRYTVYPIRQPDLWELYKKHEASFWTAEEIDLSLDLKDFDELREGERFFIKHVLAFFASSDGAVIQNLAENLTTQVQSAEAISFYAMQYFIENIHAETYALLIQTYVKDVEEQAKLFDAINCLPCVAEKAEWALHWVNADCSFAQRLVAFAVVEGVFFSSAFCSIFWMKKRGLMPGLAFANELISRDEGLHCDFACHLYREHIPEDCKPSADWVKQLVTDAIKVENNFVTSSLPVALIGMNAALMMQYVEFVTDRLMIALGYDKIYNSNNPFDWMELISLQGKTNFFERRVGEYQKAGVMQSVEPDSPLKAGRSRILDLESDF